jgi:hypothetical protein
MSYSNECNKIILVNYNLPYIYIFLEFSMILKSETKKIFKSDVAGGTDTNWNRVIGTD